MDCLGDKIILTHSINDSVTLKEVALSHVSSKNLLRFIEQEISKSNTWKCRAEIRGKLSKGPEGSLRGYNVVLGD